ncbi:tripartite tricarboxylate transporter substrate binding protein [Bordetella sp. 15P40C-2]|uniref:Bug family tripartite tricarboxylate transporter substrate binding protein n=1 Tax=Bordetella sp. 15P40C-2 TaxID=2572246 RepID=UPI001321C214|nr:tripartite tricarboxylate transporter substrate binding protein [Bordetella sp. 15P40C-2]MVW71518.1 tripartite tricarboxylate transporter substrate binding protein [Bordetella sp. 15P40C-2]
MIWKNFFAVAVVTLVSSSATWASEQPSVPLKLVVGFPPGGGTDGAARIVAEHLPKELGRPVVIENRGGAAGTLGAQSVLRSAPDGNTLFFGTSAELLINPITRKTAPYDVLKDFMPITEVGSVAFVLVAPSASKIQNVPDLIAKAKDNPGKLNFSSFGMGSTNHLIGEMFVSTTGISAAHIPYQGSAPATTALLSGDVDFTFDTVAVMQPHIKAGKLIPLATPSPHRVSELPEVATLTELGYKDLTAEGWMGIFAPVGTSEENISALNKAFQKVLERPDVQSQLAARGVGIAGGSPEKFSKKLVEQSEKWRRVAKESGISLD